MSVLIMLYDYTESGYCRVHFKVQNLSGAWIKYCIMEESIGDFYLYRTSPDGEPEYRCKLDAQFELSPGGEEIDLGVNEWILKHNMKHLEGLKLLWKSGLNLKTI
jgi:hypothetical protein